MKKVFCILGMVFSLGMTAFCIVSLFMLNYKGSGYLDSATFGADFYTYMYRASKDINSNTAYIGRFLGDIMVFFTILFAIIGAISFCFFGVKLAKETKKENPVPTAPSTPAPDFGTSETNI